MVPASTLERIDACYHPAAEVGGDFWQAFGLPDGGRLVVVGDVSGKGLQAAMLVSLIVGILDARRSDQPAEVLAELNALLCRRMQGGFVTAIAARIGSGGECLIANAGHPSSYQDGEEVAVTGGLPLGLDPDATYTEQQITLKGQLTFVSDGVIEAANSKGELFGFERTQTIALKPASEIAAAAQAWGQNDDITVVTVRGRVP